MKEQFIGEAIRPQPGSFDAARMAAGEPGLPSAFTWRGEVIRVAALRRTWRETGPCRHGSGERYVRKHWFEVEAGDGSVLTLYCERGSRGGKVAARWRLFSRQPLSPPAAPSA